jgi:hypothetical protein
MVQRASAHTKKNFLRPRPRFGDVFVAQHLRAAVLVDADGFHEGL